MSDIAIFSLDATNTVTFSLKNMKRVITGPEEALQLVASVMLQEPGSSLFANQDGGGVREILSKGMQSHESTRIDASLLVRRTMDTLRRVQRTDRPANATVVGLDLVDAVPVPNEAKITMKVRIRLLSGNSFVVNFRGK